MPPTLTNLFSDKISMTWDCGEDLGEGITEILRHTQSDNDGLIRYNRWGRLAPGYKHNWDLSIPGVEHAPVLISALSFWTNQSAFRLEWNPRHYDVTKSRMIWLRLLDILGDNLEDFLREAIVTRFDLAIDASPLKPYSILVDVTRLRKQKSIYGDRGELQSLQIGNRGSALSFFIYDKDPDTGIAASRIPDTTRIEARVKPQLNINELDQIEPIFDRLNVYCSTDPAALTGYSNTRQRINFALAQERGLQVVLQMLGRTENRNRFRNWLDDWAATDWYDPADIWSTYPEALAKLAIPEDVNQVLLYASEPTRRRRRRRRA